MEIIETNFKVKDCVSQPFGYIIICNTKGYITGVSSNFSDLLKLTTAKSLLLQDVKTVLIKHFLSVAEEILTSINDIKQGNSTKKIIKYKSESLAFFICISKHEDAIFLEWEAVQSLNISLPQINALNEFADINADSTWQSACTSILDIIQYDRVLLYQIREFGVGKVIAEATRSGQNYFLGKQFSEDFMSPELIKYYQTAPFRYCPDVLKSNIDLFCDDIPIDINQSLFNPIPDIHIEYLKNIGVRSLITFPIITNDYFWGMLICHNYEVKTIDLQKRQFCSVLTQFVAKKHEAKINQELLNYHNQIKDIELDLKEKLMSTDNLNNVLIQNLETLCKIAEADGISIFHAGDIFSYGLCPTENQILKIKDLVNASGIKPIFKDYNFRLKYEEQIEGQLPFAGLLTLQIDNQEDYYIFWFRKEVLSQIFEMDSVITLSTIEHAKKSFQMWERILKGSAIPWGDDTLYFVSSLYKLIHDITITKSKEQEKFHEELAVLHSELEMLTSSLSHDLKNPLAIAKMGTQMLQKNIRNSEEDKSKWTNIILSGIQNIESIIDGLLKLGRSKYSKFTKASVPMEQMIRKIVQEAKLFYHVETCELKLGTILPIWGEKNLVYQIFQNLISNAIKYSSFKEHPVIEITSYKINTNIYYEIKDNGIGISPDSLSNVFNMFVRGDNTENFSGTGVGLCLVKKIMDKLGGQIKIKSEVNLGTAITVVFPNFGKIPSDILISKF